MAEQELKPCPFCGGTDIGISTKAGHSECRRCGAMGPWSQHDEAFLAAELQHYWNTRPIEDALRAEVAALREQRDRMFYQFLDWRGIDVGEQCDRCQGAGTYMYGGTATWMGGVGGQMMTSGICDKCWGSGKKNKPWINLRTVMSMRGDVDRLTARLSKFEGPLTEEQREFVSKKMRVANNHNMTQWDAAIRAAREEER